MPDMPSIASLLSAGEIKPSPQNRFVGAVGDALFAARGMANKVSIPDAVPLVGGTTLGDLVFGRSPEEVNNWSYGNYPMQIVGGGTGSYVPQTKQGRGQPLADVLMGAPSVAGSAKAALSGARRAVSGALDDLAQHSAGMSGQAGKVGVAQISDADRAARMADMGMERGWYRAGEKIGPDGRRNGPMYTQDKEEAAGYLAGYERRTGRQGDLREYAIPANRFLNADKAYPPRLAHDVAKLIDTPYYGKEGQYLAGQLRTYGDGELIGGGDLWQALESRFGNDGAAEVLSQLKAFNGAKGFTAPGEAYVFKNAPVRDANRAAFDPAKRGMDDIYGAATVPGMAVGAGLGALGLEALRRTQGRE